VHLPWPEQVFHHLPQCLDLMVRMKQKVYKCRSLKKGTTWKIMNYDFKLILIVLLAGLRRHPQEQHARTTPVSEKWIYCLLERDRNVGPIPMATGVGMMYPPGKGCIGLESTTAQYVAYGESTVRTYPCILLTWAKYLRYT
jgi:hypothetical protein